MTKIIDVNVLEQYKEDMSKYGIFVNRKRMVPSVKDGLKSIHRRILYAAYNDEKAINKNVKSAAIVGTTMKSYHPHGDAAIGDAMKPMTNWFEIYMPLLQGKGNWGSFQGDRQAAPRYTESRVSEFSMDCVIGELKENKQIIDWAENYDGTKLEPEFLPVSVPLLLINGSFGIGFGLRTEIPKHNFGEVIDATIELIKNPNSEVVLIPDQCMPCDIIEANFKSISNKGNGSFKVRGIIDIETDSKGRPCLIIKSTPDMVFLDTITAKIEAMVSSKKLIQIQDMDDESTVNEMRYVITLRKGSDPNFVKDVIYKNTDMEKSFKVNFEALNGIDPVRLSYKAYLEYFIDFRKVTKFRLYCNKLQEVQTRLHERETYIKVLQSGEIDNIIYMIRNQQDINDAYLIDYLVEKLDMTDLQAAFIIKSDLRKLSKGYLQKYIEEAIELEGIKNSYLEKITNEDLLIKEIVDELKYYKKKYNVPRKCRIIKEADVSNIPKGEFKIIITENNYIKKIQLTDSIRTKGEIPKIVIKGDNTESILIFDEQGKVFKLPIHKIPFTDRNSNGTDIRTIVKYLTSNINKVIYEPVLKELTTKTRKYFITVLSKNGYIKKLDLEDFLAVPASGILYTKLDKDDYVTNVSIVASDLDIIVYSKNKALRMNLSDVPHQKRNTKGLMSMAQETVDGLSVIKPDTTDVVVITESGKINRFDIVALPTIGRNKSGNSIIKLSKGDSIQTVYGVNMTDILKVITKSNVYEFKIADIPSGTSISSGAKMLSTKTDNIIKCEVHHS